MKSRTLTCITTMTLFAALAVPVQLAAQQHTRYKLVDLGTFGGPSSYLQTNNAVNGRRVSTTLRHSDMEFSEYRRLSFAVC
jgi:hypothetical protein